MGRANKFGRLAQTLRELNAVPSQAAADAAPKIRALITKQFSSGANPYGTAWAALRPATLARGRRPPPLTDTRRMRRTIRVQTRAGSGLKISVPAPYAGFHQTGTSRMAKRLIVPDRGLPRSWREAIARSVRKRISERMGSAA